MRQDFFKNSDGAYANVDYLAQSGLIKGEIPLGEKYPVDIQHLI
jgi:hypothetical protein